MVPWLRRMTCNPLGVSRTGQRSAQQLDEAQLVFAGAEAAAA